MKRPPVMINAVTWHPRRDAIIIEPSPCRAMISITEPKQEAPLKDGWEKLLRLGFHDVQNVDEENENKYILFSQEMAEHTLDFLDDIQASVTHIYVHCYAGISRSAAIARFIADRYGLPFNREYDAYNKFVNRMLAAEDAKRMMTAPHENEDF